MVRPESRRAAIPIVSLAALASSSPPPGCSWLPAPCSRPAAEDLPSLAPPPMTANGRCRRRIMPRRAIRDSNEINADNVEQSAQVAFTLLDSASTRARKRRRSSSDNTMYVVTRLSRTSLYALDLTKPGAPMKWHYRAQPAPAAQGVACCDVVNRGAAYWRRQDLLQHARRQHDRASTPRPASSSGRRKLGDINTRRDHHHGAAGREGQGAGRQFRRRVRRARLARRRSMSTTARSSGGLSHRPRQGRADRARTSSPSTPRTGARISASRPGRRRRGRSAAARCGAGSPTIPTST